MLGDLAEQPLSLRGSVAQIESESSEEEEEQKPATLRQFVVNHRSIKTAKGDTYTNNTVKTCKYSILTFIPLDLMV